MAKFVHSDQNTSANTFKFSTKLSTEADVIKIVEMINNEAKRSGAVLPVSNAEVRGWIKSGLSFVTKTESGEIVGHHAAYIWPESGWAELRAAVVDPEFRGMGINGKLKEAVINAIDSVAKETGTKIPIVSVKNRASNGRQILSDLGFELIDKSSAPRELFDIGPKGELYDLYLRNASAEFGMVSAKIAPIKELARIV